MWGLFKKKKAQPALKPLNLERPRLKYRMKKTKPKEYHAEVALMYNGKPLRVFTATEKGYSRDVVAQKIQEGFSLKVLSCVQK